MQKILLILLFSVLAGSVLGAGVHEVDLTDPDRRLPYRATTHQEFLSNQLERGNFRGSPYVVMASGENGFDHLIKSNNHYISSISDANHHTATYFQTNLPPKYSREVGPAFTVTKVSDLDGDGEPDLVIGGVTEDFWTWGFWVMDPATGAIKSHFELSGFSEVREDGFWDGNYRVIGAINPPEGSSTGPVLILAINVGFDLEGRGLMAVDPWTGQVLWHFLTGPNPMPGQYSLSDLDGDGVTEIVMVGRSPDNLGGRLVNGFSDDVTRLFVVDRQGLLLWTRPLGPAFGNGTLQVHDLDGDGVQEIMTTAQCTPKIWGEIVVWSATGEALVRHEDKQQFTFSRFLPARADHPNRLLVTTVNNQAYLFDVTRENLDLTVHATLESTPFINGVQDVLPEPGPEIVLSTREGSVWVLDDTLNPLASLRLDPAGWSATAFILRPDSTRSFLSWGGRYRPSLTFIPTPRPLYRNPLVAGPTLLALAALMVFGVRTWTRRPRLDKATLREVRLSLLEDLELSGHGAMAPLRSLRRLLWNLGALESGLGDQKKVRERVQTTMQDCLDVALPHLQGILDRSRMVALSSDNIRYAERVLDRIKVTFDGLADQEFTGPGLGAMTSTLTSDTAKAEDALQDLRREVADFFRTSLNDQLVRVLRANEEALEEGRITVRTGYLAVAPAGAGGLAETMTVAAAEPRHCLIDPGELGFILDNLIGNAIRAMDGVSVRNLSITWSAIDGMLMIDVADTGCGIDPGDRERILDTRYSSREGGGNGLPRSRKILRKYGGSLVVQASEPGRGATLRLTLPLA